jgi:hypothetical protein
MLSPASVGHLILCAAMMLQANPKSIALFVTAENTTAGALQEAAIASTAAMVTSWQHVTCKAVVSEIPGVSGYMPVACKQCASKALVACSMVAPPS